MKEERVVAEWLFGWLTTKDRREKTLEIIFITPLVHI
jgi:hypothetical protein